MRIAGRFGRLLMLLGLTGFAISQPVLGVVGDDPTLFMFAGVDGGRIAVFALLVALVPPLALWAVVGLLGEIDRRVGDAAFVAVAGLLAGATAGQWAFLAGIEHRGARLAVGLAVAIAFGVGLVRLTAVALWTRYTAVLPALAVVLLLTASPSSALLQRPDEVDLPPANDLAPVVFVLLDEFPTASILDDDGGVDATRFPNLAEFGAGSTWYRDYTVMSNATLQSVPMLLSGRRTEPGLPLWTEHPDTLFSLLAPTHDLSVSESVTRLCGFAHCGFDGDPQQHAEGVRGLFGRATEILAERIGLRPVQAPDLGQFAEDLDPAEVLELSGGVPSTATPEARNPFGRVPRLLDAVGEARDPSLAYVHLMIPHQPWQVGATGEPMPGLAVEDVAEAADEVDEWDLAVLQQAHLLQAQYTDFVLGELFDRLRAEGRFDESLIVVTSDHGVTLDLEQFPVTRSVDERSIGDLAYVPLFIKAPGQRAGRVDDSNLMAVDLLPTVADELGIDVPWEVDGLPAGDPRVAERGDRKVLDLAEFLAEGDPTTVEFRSADHRPSARERFVGPLDEGEHLLAGLVRGIGAEDWLGESVATVDPLPGGSATLRRDGDDDLEAGRLAGTVDVGSEDGFVLLAVGDTVVTASPIQAGGRISLLVPPSILADPSAPLRLLRVDGDEVAELEIA